MADNLVIYKKCSKCNGDGELNLTRVLPPHEDYIGVCGKCKGAGRILWGWLVEEEL